MLLDKKLLIGLVLFSHEVIVRLNKDIIYYYVFITTKFIEKGCFVQQNKFDLGYTF